MKELLCSCVVALTLVTGTARGENVDVENAPGTDAVLATANANAIKLESKAIDLFADVLVVDDISGKVDGVYEDANAALLSAIANDARKILSDKVVISDAKLSNGMLLGDGFPLVYAKAGKATDQKFEGRAVDGSVDMLAPKESMPFFRELMNNPAIAPTYSALTGRDRGQRHPASFALTIPRAGLGGSSRYLLFAQATARHVPAGKSIGLGILVGLMPVSGGSVSVALIDKQSSRVLWAMQTPVRDFDQIQNVAIRLVRSLNKSLVVDDGSIAGSTASNSPEATNTGGAPDYRSIRDAKLALRAGTIDRAEYDKVAANLERMYREALANLKQKQLSGEMSDAAFEILSEKAELEYTGASSG